jgi:hypothetical protein
VGGGAGDLVRGSSLLRRGEGDVGDERRLVASSFS